MSHEGRTSNVLGCSTWNNQLADRYLGKQGTWREKQGMGNREAALSGEQIMEGNLRRNWTKSVDFNESSKSRRLDEVSQGNEKHSFFKRNNTY